MRRPEAGHRESVGFEIPGLTVGFTVFDLVGLEAMNSPFHFCLKAACYDRSLIPETLVGQAATLSLMPETLASDRQTPNQRKIQARISSLTKLEDSQQRGDGQAFYQIELMPAFGFLDATKTNRIYNALRVPDLIRLVLTEHGITQADFSGLKATYPTRAYTTQYNESALAFVSRLCEEEGIYFHYASVDGKTTLTFADQVGGYQLLKQSLTEHGGQLPQDHTAHSQTLYQFWQQGQLATTALSLQGYEQAQPFTAVTADASGGGAVALNQSTCAQFIYPLEAHAHSDLNGLVQKQLAAKRIHTEQCTAVSNNACLAAGVHISVLPPQTSAGQNQAAATEYVVTEVKHQWHKQAERVAYQNTITAIPLRTYRPPVKHLKPKQVSSEQGLVIGPEKSEHHTNAANDIKIQFPWDQTTTPEQLPNKWLRTLSPFAGKGYGWQLVPRVGQSVQAHFLHGDLDTPLVVGCFYDANHNPPFPIDGQAYKTGIKTNTLKQDPDSSERKYHEFSLDDTPKKEVIHLKSQGDLVETVDHNYSAIIGNGQTTTIGGKQKITAKKTYIQTASKSLTLKAGDSTITLAPTHITLSAPLITLNSPTGAAKSKDWGRIAKDGGMIALTVIGDIVEAPLDSIGVGEVAQVATTAKMVEEAEDLDAAVEGGEELTSERFTKVLSGASKPEAREILRKEGGPLTQRQTEKVLNYLKKGRADKVNLTTSKATGEARLSVERSGRVSGYQRISYRIDKEGNTKTVVQTAFDGSGRLVRQSPGAAKDNLYDVKKGR